MNSLFVEGDWRLFHITKCKLSIGYYISDIKKTYRNYLTFKVSKMTKLQLKIIFHHLTKTIGEK